MESDFSMLRWYTSSECFVLHHEHSNLTVFVVGDREFKLCAISYNIKFCTRSGNVFVFGNVGQMQTE